MRIVTLLNNFCKTIDILNKLVYSLFVTKPNKKSQQPQSRQDNEEGVYFQTLYLKVHNPLTGQHVERVFVGKAIFTPDEIKQIGNRPIEELIEEAHFTKPENPYENPENTKAHRALVTAIRNAKGIDD